MSPRRKKQKTGLSLGWLGPLLVSFVAGGLTVYFLMSSGHLVPLGDDAADIHLSELRDARLQLLETLLLPQARWTARELSEPIDWQGSLPDSVSLVQWNARITQGVQSLGFEILSGAEEVIPRAGRWPLQRLTLEVGESGLPLGRIMVETSRSPRLPQAF